MPSAIFPFVHDPHENPDSDRHPLVPSTIVEFKLGDGPLPASTTAVLLRLKDDVLGGSSIRMIQVRSSTTRTIRIVSPVRHLLQLRLIFSGHPHPRGYPSRWRNLDGSSRAWSQLSSPGNGLPQITSLARFVGLPLASDNKLLDSQILVGNCRRAPHPIVAHFSLKKPSYALVGSSPRSR